jgi:hypothetical protein
VVHTHALALEQDAQPPVAEAPPLTGQAAQTRPDRFVAPVLGPAHRLGVDLE